MGTFDSFKGKPDIKKMEENKDVNGLIKVLKDEDWHVRSRAVIALGYIGEPAVEPLIEALKGKDGQVRSRAAAALGNIRDERAVEPLINALKDEDWQVRVWAAEALGKMGDNRGVEPMIQDLKDEDSDVRMGAARSLGNIGDERAVEPLTQALKDEFVGVRGYAKKALEMIKAKETAGAKAKEKYKPTKQPDVTPKPKIKSKIISILKICPFCGEKILPAAIKCKHCGEWLGKKPHVEGNTSGQGNLAVVPEEIKKWNWGAFLLNWIWGIGNNVWIALLCLIPYVNIIMIFVLGAKGSEWTWQKKRWDSIEHFKNVQKKWAIAGLVLFIFGIVMVIILSAIIASLR